MGRRFVWLNLSLVALVACSERLTAPGECPEFCPPTLIEVIDTVIRGAIVRDSSYRGYVQARNASALQVAREADTTLSRAILQFFRFPDSVRAVSSDPRLSPIVSIDSFRLRFNVERVTDLDGLELALYRLPIGLDSATTLVDVAPFFDDSTLIAVIPIPDTLTTDTIPVDTVAVVLLPSAFPTFDADTGAVAFGVTVRGATDAFLDLTSFEGSSSPVVTRFVTVDSLGSGVELPATDARQPMFDTFLFEPPDPPVGDVLVVGGAPSSRSLLRIELPAAIIDSSEIVRGTLIIVPSEPAFGAPGDTFLLRADGLSADFGPKSPLLGVTPAQLGLGLAEVPSGTTDTIRIDITHIMAPWRTSQSLPRSLIVRVVPEGAGLGEVRLGSTRQGSAPALHLTYVPLVGGGN